MHRPWHPATSSYHSRITTWLYEFRREAEGGAWLQHPWDWHTAARSQRRPEGNGLGGDAQAGLQMVSHLRDRSATSRFALQLVRPLRADVRSPLPISERVHRQKELQVLHLVRGECRDLCALGDRLRLSVAHGNGGLQAPQALSQAERTKRGIEGRWLHAVAITALPICRGAGGREAPARCPAAGVGTADASKEWAGCNTGPSDNFATGHDHPTGATTSCGDRHE
mmetsp:Transcript_12285/g.28729  ORF Transcript_12285/g.28729 Transcript_12285/m.28729 type:complete len:225 (+) Transcript_12285:354-1028(+)